MSDSHFKAAVKAARCAVVTISDTRTPETDDSGRAIRELLITAGHVVHAHGIVPDEPNLIRRRVTELSADPDCEAILTTGGTGLSARDLTCEAITPLFSRHIDGFGELFRSLSHQEIGAAAMLSRAVAGTIGKTAVFAMPGSPAAVRLAMEKLILPQIRHLIGLLRG